MDPKGKVNTFEDVMRANLALFDYLLLDENIQVNGLVFVIDLTGFTRHHFVSSGVDNTRKCMLVTQVRLQLAWLDLKKCSNWITSATYLYSLCFAAIYTCIFNSKMTCQQFLIYRAT